MATPEISIILPVHNVEPYVKQCLDSIVSQTYGNFELLCVDDCGTDDSMEVVRDFAEHDKRIRILRHNKNQGLGAARNTGMNLASGEFITFIDSDDWVLPDFLKTLHATISTHDVGSVWANHLVYSNGDGTLHERRQQHHAFAEYYGIIPLTGSIIRGSHCETWNKIFRIEAIRRYGLQFSHIFAEDLEFHYKFHSLSSSICLLDESNYVYRRRDDSGMGIISKGDFQKLEELFQIFENCYCFAMEEGFSKREISILFDIISDHCFCYVDLRHGRNAIFPLVKKFQERLNIPYEYTSKQDGIFYYMDHFSHIERIAYHGLWYLNKLNPIANKRREYRRKITKMLRPSSSTGR